MKQFLLQSTVASGAFGGGRVRVCDKRCTLRHDVPRRAASAWAGALPRHGSGRKDTARRLPSSMRCDAPRRKSRSGASCHNATGPLGRTFVDCREKGTRACPVRRATLLCLRPIRVTRQRRPSRRRPPIRRKEAPYSVCPGPGMDYLRSCNKYRTSSLGVARPERAWRIAKSSPDVCHALSGRATQFTNLFVRGPSRRQSGESWSIVSP